jgi:CTP:phosphocholine cytidylyltransferase-like protein
MIKIQLRVNLKQAETDKFKLLKRSLSKVQTICNEDYTDLFNSFNSSLYLLSEEYENCYISSFILFYSICSEDSILKKSILVLDDNKSK